MADAAVEFVLNNLKDLLAYHSHLITDTRSKIESLGKELLVFKAYLTDSVQQRRNDVHTKVVVQDIRNVVYKLEDIMDAFVTQEAQIRARNFLIRAWRSQANLHSFGLKVNEITAEVQRCKVDFANLKVDDDDKSKNPEVDRGPRSKHVVGFKDVTDKLKVRLLDETKYFDVISLVGLFGLGKTTLAWKVFTDPEIEEQFPVRIWLTISQDFSNRDMFLEILEKITNVTEVTRRKQEQELSQMAARLLNGIKFLIVMDDVWATSDWDRLTKALPEHNHMGKVLITSRYEVVGKYVSKPRDPLTMRQFTDEESWELLRLEALGKLDCPPELVDAGFQIARECKGMPLGVVVVGGFLATEYSSADIGKVRKEWEEVPKRVKRYLTVDDPANRMNNLISLNYKRLHDHLRACFLYLGMFPEDCEIPVSKLILMWIAEGFIQHSSYCSLEETAEKYLKELIAQNLVKAVGIKNDGQYKTCRIHDSLRDFCITESGLAKENFFQEIKYKDDVFDPPISDLDGYHRLSIHSNCSSFISSKPSPGPRVRSFVCFSKDDGFTLPKADTSVIPAAFKMLRVLDVRPIIFTKIPSDMYQLVHVRYIALSLNLPTLPSKFNQLWNIQTLIVDTTSHMLDVKADVCKMKRLRHFKTNVHASLPKPSKNTQLCPEMQSLGTISAESCRAELFDRARNLKKLGVRGPLSMFFQGKIGSFDGLGKLKKLEKLKLINDPTTTPSEAQLSSELKSPTPPLEDQLLLVLPNAYKFPSALKSLTLSAISLDRDDMTNLGLLEKLEVLKLKNVAFMDNIWKTKGGGFACLEFLHIEHKDLAVWEASSHHFRRLRGLVLRNCEKLEGIPVELADIPSFQMLNLHSSSEAAVAAAKDIDATKQANGRPFNLSISIAIS